MLVWLRRWFGFAVPDAPRVSVHAEHNSVAAGRNINNSTIKIGLNEEEIRRRLAATEEKLLLAIAREKGVEAAPLRAVLEKLGEVGVPEAEIPARLASAADQLIELRAQLARLRNDRPGLATIRQQALELINRGDLDGARAALNQGREVARGLREETSRSEAELLADEARIDHLQLAYREAAAKYAEAAALVAPFNQEALWHFLTQQTRELYDHGREFGDNQALCDAIAVYRRALVLVPRAEHPLDWAMTQMNLGVALRTLGERESGTERLEEAVQAYGAALQEFTQERSPREWATTQDNLGSALTDLGELESGTNRLEKAIAAYQAALEERTRERVPLQWATTQNNLGTALVRLGDRQSGTEHWEQALATYRAVLEERTRERVPLQWATTQNNLGNVLTKLGMRKGEMDRLEEAVAAFRAALKERTRERVPLQWAQSQLNLGNVLLYLSKREGGTDRLEEAIAICRELESLPQELPHEQKRTLKAFAKALTRRCGRI